ncbi:unnamed protein product [Paramecium octaurelia]|uniref:WD40-repeat-containing domain n=1 Tax=Paramecium octaurelia TaxID=43137 RepID=A0A8S1W6G3_PAROT|nr:unnamed protein product [Paramecium octaurelia]
MNSSEIQKENYIQTIAMLRKEIRFHQKQDSKLSKSNNSSLSLYNINNQQQLEDHQSVNGYEQQNHINKSGDQFDSKITQIENQPYFDMLSQAEKYMKLVLNIGYNLQPLALEKILEGFETIPCRLIKQVSKPEICQVFSFNSNNTLLATSQGKNIQIFNFMNGEFEENVQFQAHNADVTSLVFSKKSNYLLSGGMDDYIYLWEELRGQNQWQKKISINTKSPISCMIFNKLENLIIVGNKYGFLQIWSLNIENNLIKIVDEKRQVHKNTIYAVSLNSSENRIITCSVDKQIILWGIDERGWLEMIASQERQNYVTRILFLNDNRILLAQNKKGLIQLKLENDKFQEKEQIIIEDLSEDHHYFPIQYNQIRNIIIIKHNRFIYILSNLQKDAYELLKKLEFQSMKIYGTLSTDRRHLVIYNEEKIQIYEIFE